MKESPHAIYKFLPGLAVGLLLITSPVKAEMNCSALPPMFQVRIVSCLDKLIRQRNTELSMEELDAAARDLFLHGYNSSPPPTAVLADTVRIYTKPYSRRAFVVIGLGGRTVEAAEVPLEVVNIWRAGKPWEDPKNSL